MKHQEVMKKVLAFPEGEEKEGRLQAILDLNDTEANPHYYIGKAEFNMRIENRVKYWDDYLDTFKALKEDG